MEQQAESPTLAPSLPSGSNPPIQLSQFVDPSEYQPPQQQELSPVSHLRIDDQNEDDDNNKSRDKKSSENQEEEEGNQLGRSLGFQTDLQVHDSATEIHKTDLPSMNHMIFTEDQNTNLHLQSSVDVENPINIEKIPSNGSVFSNNILELQEEEVSELGEVNEQEIEGYDLLKLDIVISKPSPVSLLCDDSMDNEGKELTELERYFREQNKLIEAQNPQQVQAVEKPPSFQQARDLPQFDLFSSLFDEAEIIKHPKDKSTNLIIIEEESDIAFEINNENRNDHAEKAQINLFRRSVLVSEPEVIAEGYLTTYKLYNIRTKEHGFATFDTEVLRRFSDFEWLHMELVNNFGGYLIPLLPEKSFLTKFNAETDYFSKNRQRGLEFFLMKLLEHPHLHLAPQLKLFLCSQDTEFSIVKGEAESLKTIEQKCNVVIGSMKNYFSQNIAPLFGQQQIGEKLNIENSSRKNDRDKEIDKELCEFEANISSSSQIMKNFIEVSSIQIKCLEEEITDSSRLNDLIPGSRHKIIDQDILNLKEGLLFQWQKQFHTKIEEWQRNTFAALEALNRRNEIISSIQKDSSRISQLKQLNKKKNNQRDTEMDILQNNLQKNSLRLERITHVLLAEIRTFQVEQNQSLNAVISKFIEMQSEFHFKKNELSQGRVPNLL